MSYYQIISEDAYCGIFTDELTTNLPFGILNLKVGNILPADEIFPERKIIKIISDDDRINNELAAFARSKRNLKKSQNML